MEYISKLILTDAGYYWRDLNNCDLLLLNQHDTIIIVIITSIYYT